MESPHRGEVLKAALKKSGQKLSAFAKALGVHRNTLSGYFENPDLPDTLLLQAGKLLNHDFSAEVPALEIYRLPAPEGQAPAPRIPQTLPECQRELLSVYRKYADLLEEHLQLRRMIPA